MKSKRYAIWYHKDNCWISDGLILYQPSEQGLRDILNDLGADKITLEDMKGNRILEYAK